MSIIIHVKYIFFIFVVSRIIDINVLFILQNKTIFKFNEGNTFPIYIHVKSTKWPSHGDRGLK